MGVPCSRCGRQYDVTLFEFGRTIHCTCGERVGLEPRVRELGDEGGPLFIADAMLARLAHWLRILGFDCAHEAEIPDGRLVHRALEERRVILTRDVSLPEEWRILGIRLVAAKTPLAQLREVVAEFKLAEAAKPFTRCSRCNTLLTRTSAAGVRELERESAAEQQSAAEQESEKEPQQALGRVPSRVLQAQKELWRCHGCERIYWEGTHTDEMRRVVDEILNEQKRSGAPDVET